MKLNCAVTRGGKYSMHIKKQFITSITLFLLMVLVSCIGGENELKNRQRSANPFGAQIILPNAFSDLIFGNLCDMYDVEVIVNPELTPNGSTVLVELNSPDLPPNLRGCIIEADTEIIASRALGSFVSGFLRGVEETATVNVGVTIIPPNGDPQSDFVPITINGVDCIAPEDTDLEVPNPMDMEALDVFLTLPFQTVGIKPGTMINFTLSNPGLGSLTVLDNTVNGSIENGQVTIEYDALRVGGTQQICGEITLNYPPAFVPPCPSIPDQVIQCCVVITQSVSEGMMDEDDMMMDPSLDSFSVMGPITAPGSTTATAETSNFEGGTVCYEVSNDPSGTGCIPNPVCSPVDAAGVSTTIIESCNNPGTVNFIACLDSGDAIGCDPGEPFLNGSLTVM